MVQSTKYKAKKGASNLPRRNVSLGMHDRDFLKGRGVRDSSTCEPGFRHTGGWLALLGSSRLPARLHSNFSTSRGVTSLLCTMHAAATKSACTHAYNDASFASTCYIMSSRMIGACTSGRIILPRVCDSRDTQYARSHCRRSSVAFPFYLIEFIN